MFLSKNNFTCKNCFEKKILSIRYKGQIINEGCWHYSDKFAFKKVADKKELDKIRPELIAEAL